MTRLDLANDFAETCREPESRLRSLLTKIEREGEEVEEGVGEGFEGSAEMGEKGRSASRLRRGKFRRRGEGGLNVKTKQRKSERAARTSESLALSLNSDLRDP